MSNDNGNDASPRSYELLEKYLGRPVTLEEREQYEQAEESQKTFLPPSCQPHYFPTVECEHVVRSLAKGNIDPADRSRCLDLHAIFLGCVAEHVESGEYQSDHPKWQQWVQQHHSMKERMESLQKRQMELQKNMRELPLEQKIEGLKRMGMTDEEAAKMAPKFGVRKMEDDMNKASTSPVDELRRKYREAADKSGGGSVATATRFSTTDRGMGGISTEKSSATEKPWWKVW